MNHRLAILCAAVLLCAATQASVLRVPSEYTTIQAAIENVQTNDTVLVASGTYAEALTTSTVSFYLMGESSIWVERPVIDPSSLADPASLSCLIWNSTVCHIRNFVFRNRAPMFPHHSANEGGVVLYCISADLTNCLFDSTNTGLYRSGTTSLTLDHCLFNNCVRATVGGTPGFVSATDCLFREFGLRCGGGSTFIRCDFDSISTGATLIPYGALNLESCVFENQNTPFHPTIDAGNVNPSIRNCIIRNCLVSRAVVFITRDCEQDMLIENNHFENITTSSDAGQIGLSWGCANVGLPGLVAIRNNTFINCSAAGPGKCILAGGGDNSTIFLERNRFIDIAGNAPTVWVPDGNVIARDNIFINTEYALATEQSGDASYNYWGDPTGPYNATFNPNGLGDEVSDLVIFTPWFADSTLDVPDQPGTIPSQFLISVYPNPFNSTATLALEVPVAFIASIELFNTLGQHVREIHRGPVYGHEKFFLNADNLPSGIYFVTVRDIVQNSVHSSLKIALIK